MRRVIDVITKTALIVGGAALLTATPTPLIVAGIILLW